MNKCLYEILVPCQFEDTKKPVSTKHHKAWDSVVRSISGGLTILHPCKGQWIFENKLYEDRVIPVRIMCSRKELDKIIEFTIKHYRQLAVMAYKISDEVIIEHKKAEPIKVKYRGGPRPSMPGTVGHAVNNRLGRDQLYGSAYDGHVNSGHDRCGGNMDW